MPEKMMTLEELSYYLGIKEDKIISLVEDKIIAAYKIGGELLRFRKEQIDAIRAELDRLVKESDRITLPHGRKKSREKLKMPGREMQGNNFFDAVSDFFYFNDFYMIAGILICVLLVIIFRG
ncbi:MAG: helix-turn-helix domain-containing protein [Candidatus Omnitrophota bacterium]